MGLTPYEKKMLIDDARRAVTDFLEKGIPADTMSPAPDLPQAFHEARGVFVAIYLAGRLRGCMGMPTAILPLWQACRICARNAACRDPRFPPLTVEDLPGLGLEITLIGDARPFVDISQIRGGTCGLILQKGFRREVFMPGAVQRVRGGREDIMRSLRDKVSIDADAEASRETWMVFDAETWNGDDL